MIRRRFSCQSLYLLRYLYEGGFYLLYVFFGVLNRTTLSDNPISSWEQVIIDKVLIDTLYLLPYESLITVYGYSSVSWDLVSFQCFGVKDTSVLLPFPSVGVWYNHHPFLYSVKSSTDSLVNERPNSTPSIQEIGLYNGRFPWKNCLSRSIRVPLDEPRPLVVGERCSTDWLVVGKRSMGRSTTLPMFLFISHLIEKAHKDETQFGNNP